MRKIRAAEAGMRRCDELYVTSKKIDDGQPWIDVLKAVKQQQRIARASALDTTPLKFMTKLFSSIVRI